MRVIVAALSLCGVALIAQQAQAQQTVVTATSKYIAVANCAATEAMLNAIQDGEAKRKADIRKRLNALLDAALVSSELPETAQSRVVFPPRYGS